MGCNASFYLCSSFSERNLKTLDLKGCGIGEPGAAELAKCLACSALEELDLSKNKDLGDAGAAAVARGLPRIRDERTQADPISNLSRRDLLMVPPGNPWGTA